jgi:hypothetical protein
VVHRADVSSAMMQDKVSSGGGGGRAGVDSLCRSGVDIHGVNHEHQQVLSHGEM